MPETVVTWIGENGLTWVFVEREDDEATEGVSDSDEPRRERA